MILGICFFLLAAAGWYFGEKSKFDLLKLVHFGFLMGAAGLLFHEVDVQNNMVWIIPLGLALLHLVLSFVLKIKNDLIITGLVLLSGGAFFVSDITLTDFLGFDVEFRSAQTLIPFVFGAIAIPVVNSKEKVLGKFFKLDFKTQRGISRSAFFFFFGISVLISYFLAGNFGLLFLGIGFGSHMFYNKRSGAMWNILLGVVGFILIGMFLNKANVSSADLQLGRVLTGLFFAAGISLIVNTLQRARKNKSTALAISLGLPIIFPALLIFAGTQNVQFGGFDSFVGLLVGFVLTSFLGINIKKNVYLLGIFVGVGCFMSEMMSTEMQEGPVVELNVSSKSSNSVAQPTYDDHIGILMMEQGNYMIQSDSSTLNFELGPKGGRTKGAFKSFEGQIDFASKSMEASLDVSTITTFNSYRDESLMDEPYFHVSKFPNITYSSNQFVLIDETKMEYEVQGKMKMLGTERDQKMTVKFLKNDLGQMLLIGQGQIDRREYNMSSDPKEGHVVDFEVTALLNSN